ncbi:putative hydrolase of the HAD superfamily [Paramicrobacterium humi]|uniref:Putative hydrolase of the HAD superfamily n=1 Tax=Paramicrobacterium humi TaxID=640635 RepID=A0A1H4IZ34_9MICO|nr:HAD family hydrolase [Microbacterium humi]SEB39227.1 putative hydrolase of the HAD superfamily [Microbacterium humi]
MAAPRVFVFDIDGVVRTFRPERMAARLRDELDAPLGVIERVAFSEPLARELVEGRLTRAAWVEVVAERVARHARHPEHAASVVAEWASDTGQLVPRTIALIDELRREHPVFALTNGTDTTRQELEAHGILGHFVRVLNSYEIGVAKPDRACFAAAHAGIEAALGHAVDAASVHFTDDLENNVAAATEFGWHARVFTDAESLARSIRQLLGTAN